MRLPCLTECEISGNERCKPSVDLTTSRRRSITIFAAEDETLQTGEGNDDDRLPVEGGAFYDLAAQCLAPLIGGRGGAATDEGQRSDVVQARPAGDSSASTVIFWFVECSPFDVVLKLPAVHVDPKPR